MELKDYFLRQLHFNRWAAERMLDHITAQDVNEGNRIYDLFAHCLGAEAAWLGRWRGQAPALELWPKLERSKLPGTIQQHYDAFRAILQETGDPTARRTLNSPTGPMDMALMDILDQLILHAHYHRGQMNTLLRQAGKEPTLIGFFGFVREGN